MTTHEDKIRQLLETSQRKRLDTAMEAGQTAQTLAELQQQLASTETAYSRAYRAAVDAGWTDKELKQIGLTKPAGRSQRVNGVDPQKHRDPDTP